MSCLQTKRIIKRYNEVAPLHANELCSLVDDLIVRIRDEASTLSFLSLTKKEEDLFNPDLPLFGMEFTHRFPSEGSFEVDEAAKCLALGRFTAAVFHLMRVMEIGIRALARCLGIADPVKPAERNWGKILKTIKEHGLDAKWPSPSDRMIGDGALFESMIASLDAVRNPWRNSTMHVENKYTEEEAEHIFFAVKGFMKKLASRCDEQGEPKA